MRTHLQHACNNKMDKLSDDISEPSFLADPSHIIKVICKEVFRLVLASKATSDCKLIDALRFNNILGILFTKTDTYHMRSFVKRK